MKRKEITKVLNTKYMNLRAFSYNVFYMLIISRLILIINKHRQRAHSDARAQTMTFCFGTCTAWMYEVRSRLRNSFRHTCVYNMHSWSWLPKFWHLKAFFYFSIKRGIVNVIQKKDLFVASHVFSIFPDKHWKFILYECYSLFVQC